MTPDLINIFGVKDHGFEPIYDLNLIGGKGSGLARMCNWGLNVPEGFTLTTKARQGYDLNELVKDGLSAIGGGNDHYYSVRSGSAVSMEGMMDSIMNVGVTCSGNKQTKKLTKTAHKACEQRFFNAYLSSNHVALPETIEAVLAQCVSDVYSSWGSQRAIAYREKFNISEDLGTAVTVQRMVFGNLNKRSCTGVVFSRCPKTGGNWMTGEWLPKAQGDDLVSGDRTPNDILTLEEWDPTVFDELKRICIFLESSLEDMVDIEFTVEDGQLWILQVRAATRTAVAEFKIAYDMLMDPDNIMYLDKALSRVSVDSYNQLKVFRVDPDYGASPIYKGIPASPGISIGAVTSDKNQVLKDAGGTYVFQTEKTSPKDFSVLINSKAVVTGKGGFTSHPALTARSLNIPAVVGVGNLVVEEGVLVTVDGSSGMVYLGEAPVVGGKVPKEALELINQAIVAKGLLVHYALESSTMPELILKLEALPMEGKVMLYVGGLTLTKYKAVNKVLMFVHKFRPDLTGVLSFARIEIELGEGDTDFLNHLGIDEDEHSVADFDAVVYGANLMQLKNKNHTKKIKTKWSVQLDPGVQNRLHQTIPTWGWTLVKKLAGDAHMHMTALGMTLEEYLISMDTLGKRIEPVEESLGFDEAVIEVLS